MKKFITLSIIALITSCSGTPGEFSIKGMADTKDGTMIYRIVADANNQPMIIDSVAVASVLLFPQDASVITKAAAKITFFIIVLFCLN